MAYKGKYKGKEIDDLLDQVASGGSSSGGSGAYAEVNHGTSDTTFALTPNTFHIWDEVASLDLSFADEQAGVANEYLFQFTSGATATMLTLPDGLKWANDSAPTIAENMIYQVSVLKGLASVLEFPSKSIITFIVEMTTTKSVNMSCEDGMTWEEFINSEYNNNTFYIDAKYNNQIRWVETYAYGVENVTPSSIIENGVIYTSKYGS